jgi:hypothetical protein
VGPHAASAAPSQDQAGLVVAGEVDDGIHLLIGQRPANAQPTGPAAEDENLVGQKAFLGEGQRRLLAFDDEGDMCFGPGAPDGVQRRQHEQEIADGLGVDQSQPLHGRRCIHAAMTLPRGPWHVKAKAASRGLTVRGD